MKNKIIVFDVDGVISISPVRKIGSGIAGRWRFFLLFIPQFRQLYDHLRKVNPEIKKLMLYLHKHGWKVYVVTGNRTGYSRGLEKWLDRKGICYNSLFCYHSSYGNGISVGKWKAAMARKLKADFFIEDWVAIAREIAYGSDTQVILYKNQTLEELLMLIKP